MAKKKKFYNGRNNESLDMYMRESRSMLYEDRNAPSNCPMDVKVKQYPPCEYLKTNVQDDIEEIDMTRNNAVRTAQKYMAKKKY